MSFEKKPKDPSTPDFWKDLSIKLSLIFALQNPTLNRTEEEAHIRIKPSELHDKKLFPPTV